MTDKELRRLSRRDLLEMLINQTKELNRVKNELAEVREALNHRQILLSESGSIAEAALKLNKVFEAAQEAADQYLSSVRQLQGGGCFPQVPTPDAEKKAAEDLLRKTRQECDELRAKTEAECFAMREAARKECEAVLTGQQVHNRAQEE